MHVHVVSMLGDSEPNIRLSMRVVSVPSRVQIGFALAVEFPYPEELRSRGARVPDNIARLLVSNCSQFKLARRLGEKR